MASGRRKILSFSVAAFMTVNPVLVLAADAATGDETKQQTQNLPAIVVSAAETRTIIDRVIATGTVQAVEEVYVVPLVDGLSIRTLAADVGDTVEADGTLATLNDDALILEKSQNEASLAKANAALAAKAESTQPSTTRFSFAGGTMMARNMP